MRKLHSIALNLGCFVLVMRLDLCELLIRCLDGLLGMLSSNLRVVLSLCSLLEFRMNLSKLGLSCLSVLTQRFNKGIALSLGNFVVCNE